MNRQQHRRKQKAADKRRKKQLRRDLRSKSGRSHGRQAAGLHKPEKAGTQVVQTDVGPVRYSPELLASMQLAMQKPVVPSVLDGTQMIATMTDEELLAMNRRMGDPGAIGISEQQKAIVLPPPGVVDKGDNVLSPEAHADLVRQMEEQGWTVRVIPAEVFPAEQQIDLSLPPEPGEDEPDQPFRPTFKKQGTGYDVYDGDRFLGYVEKHRSWWTAQPAGAKANTGEEFKTRGKAAESLQ